ncbi:hypothetical protein [Serratia fonticola]
MLQITEQLIFRPASELPAADLNGKEVMVLNPRDGWHTGTIYTFKEEGKAYRVGIYSDRQREMLPHDFYVAWALLPDSVEMSRKFED